PVSTRGREHLQKLSSWSGARSLARARELVAADVIRTVALAPSLQNVLVLGLLVLIRTFLGSSLVVALEERWPWQTQRRGEAGGVDGLARAAEEKRTRS